MAKKKRFFVNATKEARVALLSGRGNTYSAIMLPTHMANASQRRHIPTP